VGKNHGTYVRQWENIEGGLGEVMAPWEVVNEEMKGEVQLMGRGKVGPPALHQRLGRFGFSEGPKKALSLVALGVLGGQKGPTPGRLLRFCRLTLGGARV
jgi:hypothetical protein